MNEMNEKLQLSYMFGVLPTIFRIPKAIRLWRPVSSIATATINPPKKSIEVP